MLNTDTSTIHELFCQLDQLQITFQEPNLGGSEQWLPESPQGQDIFRKLVAANNRDALKKWYACLQNSQLNPGAKNLKRSLEKAIGEKLS